MSQRNIDEYVNPVPEQFADRDKVLNYPLTVLHDRWLELRCCKGVTLLPINLLLSQGRNNLLVKTLHLLKCSRCGGPPREVRLNETAIRVFCGGAEPGWSVVIRDSLKPRFK